MSPEVRRPPVILPSNAISIAAEPSAGIILNSLISLLKGSEVIPIRTRMFPASSKVMLVPAREGISWIFPVSFHTSIVLAALF